VLVQCLHGSVVYSRNVYGMADAVSGDGHRRVGRKHVSCGGVGRDVLCSRIFRVLVSRHRHAYRSVPGVMYSVRGWTFFITICMEETFRVFYVPIQSSFGGGADVRLYTWQNRRTVYGMVSVVRVYKTCHMRFDKLWRVVLQERVP